MSKHYLTKSRFKLALECPTKLYYAALPEYANTKSLDPFLLALAKGGFQVEEYARRMYGPGVMVDSRKPDEAVAHTNRAIASGKVVFEGAFVHGNLYVRSDMIRSEGAGLELIEIKAKSFDGNSNVAKSIMGSKGGIKSEWKAYLWDVAFQVHVVSKVFPEREVTPYLLMADKSKAASIDGLHEKFKVVGGADMRAAIEVDESFDSSKAGSNLLVLLNVKAAVDRIINGAELTPEGLTFLEAVDVYAQSITAGVRIDPVIGRKCKSCEFRLKEGTSAEKEAKKSGFHACWMSLLAPSDIDAPKPYDIWNNRNAEKQIKDEGILLACDLGDFSGSVPQDSIDTSQRQQLQLESIKHPDAGITVLRSALKAALASHQFPLHFIDFETSTNPLPHFKGQRPYEQVAFQFSHHTLSRDGTLRHATQFLQTDAGMFPNFEFVRALKTALGSSGSIFRYAHHENSVLRQIYEQLDRSGEKDKTELMDFIDEITQVKGGGVGNRNMVDLRTLVMDYYFNPLMKGSNSMKVLLPATIQCSESVRRRLAQPLSENGLHSLNFGADWVWLKEGALDPYKSLPPPFSGMDEDKLSAYFDGDETLAEGGAATMAYGKLQYTTLTEQERSHLNKALLRYCELDTLAMVIVYWHLRELAHSREE